MKEIFCAETKYIKGKKDKGKHDGRAANVRREQEAKQKLKEYTGK